MKEAMKYEEIMRLTALETGRAIKEKRLTAVEAVQAALWAIERMDKGIHAYITVCREAALEQAKEIQKRLDQGDVALMSSPLAGVPIAVKDNICTRDVKTSCASRIMGDFTPFYDATVVRKLKDAGMIIIGKTNMDEFAMGSTTETSWYGLTRNPWNPDRVPGGSSGGSAAAVASGEAVIAIGSDTGGSIRQPAAYCGVTGLKPTYGMVSRYGLIAYASSLDQIGPIGRDAADCAALMDLIASPDEMDGTSLPSSIRQQALCGAPDFVSALTGNIQGMRIGIPWSSMEEGVDPDVRQAVKHMSETLQSLGAEVKPVTMDFIDYVIPTYYIIAAAEASSNLSRFDGVRYGFRAEDYEDLTDMYSKTRSEGFGSEVKKRILLGTFVLSSGYYDAYYKKALQVKALIKQGFDEIFGDCDAILLPAAPSTAPKLGESLADPLKMYLSDIFTVAVNIAGLPGLSVPSGFDKSGMPIGTQIIGPALGDGAILKIGHAFQQATEYHKARPEMGQDQKAPKDTEETAAGGQECMREVK